MATANWETDAFEGSHEERVFVFPTSFSQQRLWFLDQLKPGNQAYNVPATVRLKGRLNIQALERSTREIISRHETLRTRFEQEDGQPVQVISPGLPDDIVVLPLIDLSALSESQRNAEALRLALEEATRVFSLSKGPLFETRLARIEEDSLLLMLTMHHTISDGWSVEVLVKELCLLYKAFDENKESPLGQLPIQYADYAVWQREWLQGELLEKQVDYWIARLSGANPLLELPLDHVRPPVQTFRGAHEHFDLPAPLVDSITEIGRQENATLFMIMLATFKGLLYRYTGQEDILVGSPIANRRRIEIQDLIGCFVNTIVLRTDLSGNPSFRELLRGERAASLEAFLNSDIPFEMIVERMNLEWNPSYNPIFQVMFLIQSVPTPPVELPGLEVSYLHMDVPASKFDLSLAMEDTGLKYFLEYNADLFEASTMRRVGQHFRNLLEGIAQNPDERVGFLPLMKQAEQDQILFEWNRTQVDFPKDLRVPRLMEIQAERVPDAIAITFKEGSITFKELDRRANQLARRLARLGIGPESPVGICVERSTEWVVALLGVFKAGGAQVLLDPAYPAERLTLMLEDAKAAALITQRWLEPVLPPEKRGLIFLDSTWETIREEEEDSLTRAGGFEEAAYIVYTSGSTGRPKAVVNTHAGLLNLILSFQRELGITGEDRFSQVARMGFDASVWELWTYLTAGASGYLLDDELKLSPLKLRDCFASNQITIGFLPPALSETVLYEDWPHDVPLRTLLTGSDKASVRPPEELPFRYINCYGPTEAAVIVTLGEILPASSDSGPPRIGRPLPNSQVYVLDRYMQPVPIGVTGELHIGGAHLARGYLNHPELTAEKFIPNPFSPKPGDRLYKTGDLCRYIVDGAIEFLGRIDHQVKIRGFRIELGEIESLLCEHAAVAAAAAVLREDRPGEKRIVAYVAPAGEEISADSLREFLRKRLPDYMIPYAFVMLDKLPVTRNGKLDRSALQALGAVQSETTATYVRPRNELEQTIAEVLQEFLQIERVGLFDNFFDLGAHSLLIVRIRTALQERLNKEIPIVEMYKNPSISLLAKYLANEVAEGQALSEGYGRADTRKALRKRRKS